MPLTHDDLIKDGALIPFDELIEMPYLANDNASRLRERLRQLFIKPVLCTTPRKSWVRDSGTMFLRFKTSCGFSATTITMEKHEDLDPNQEPGISVDDIVAWAGIFRGWPPDFEDRDKAQLALYDRGSTPAFKSAASQQVSPGPGEPVREEDVGIQLIIVENITPPMVEWLGTRFCLPTRFFESHVGESFRTFACAELVQAAEGNMNFNFSNYAELIHKGNLHEHHKYRKVARDRLLATGRLPPTFHIDRSPNSTQSRQIYFDISYPVISDITLIAYDDDPMVRMLPLSHVQHWLPQEHNLYAITLWPSTAIGSDIVAPCVRLYSFQRATICMSPGDENTLIVLSPKGPPVAYRLDTTFRPDPGFMHFDNESVDILREWKESSKLETGSGSEPMPCIATSVLHCWHELIEFLQSTGASHKDYDSHLIHDLKSSETFQALSLKCTASLSGNIASLERICQEIQLSPLHHSWKPSTQALHTLLDQLKWEKSELVYIREAIQHRRDAILADQQQKSTAIQIQESRRAIDQADSVRRLTILAFIFVPVSAVGTLFGMNVRELDSDLPSFWVFFVTALAVLGTSVLFALTTRIEKRIREIGSLIRAPDGCSPNWFNEKPIWVVLWFVILAILRRNYKIYLVWPLEDAWHFFSRFVSQDLGPDSDPKSAARDPARIPLPDSTSDLEIRDRNPAEIPLPLGNSAIDHGTQVDSTENHVPNAPNKANKGAGLKPNVAEISPTRPGHQRSNSISSIV